MEKQEYKNDKFTMTVERLPHCKVKLSVQSHLPSVEGAMQQAIKNVSKEVTLPGFRKGRAPDAMVLSNYGKHVTEEYRDVITHQGFEAAAKEAKVFPMKESKINMTSFKQNDDKTVDFSLEFEAYPDVPAIDPEKISLKKPSPKEISAKDIENELEELRLYHATWTDVADRPVQEGDFVVIDLDFLDEPTANALKDSRVHVTEGKIPEWAKKLVLGKNVGDKVEGLNEKDEKSSEDFKQRQCCITIHKIQTAEKPEINDELAKKAGVDTAEELRKRIEERQHKQDEMEQKNNLRLQARDYVVDNYPFDLPDSRLKEIRQYAQETASQGHHSNYEDLKNAEDRIYDNVEKNNRLSYILSRLVQEQKIPQPDQGAITQRLISMYMQIYQNSGEQPTEQVMEYLKSQAINELQIETALDYLVEKAKIV